MGYTAPPMPTRGEQSNSALMDVLTVAERAIKQHGGGLMAAHSVCAYCHTPKRDAYASCPNCGAYEIEMVR